MKNKRSKISAFLFAVMLCFTVTAGQAAQKELPKRTPGSLPVVLEADSVSFDERAHTVLADGHAVVTYQDLVLHADRITMDSQENVIRGYAADGKRIRMQRTAWNALIGKTESQTLTGTFLEYHIDDSTGFLEGAEGSTTAENGMVFVAGGTAEVAPPEVAHKRGWAHGHNLKRSLPEDMIVRWNDASYTTCRQDDPHYHFVSKKAVLIPNRYIILNRPRVYAGKRFLFTVPFDIRVNQGPRRRNKLSVVPNYDSDKRYGLQATYTIPWKNGRVKLGAAIWTKGISEYDYRVDHKLTDWLSVYGGSNYHYDDDLRETKSRPFWGMIAEHSGWAMELGWAEREKRSIVKRPGEKEYETTLWRKPEFEITSPWIGLHIGDVSQYLRFKGDWGKFEETGVNRRQYKGGFIERYGWGVDYYTDYPFRIGLWTVSPFFKFDYWNYAYKDYSDRQIITTGTVGLRASSGIFEMGSAYEQRRVSGSSAFGNGWDRSSDADTFYQRVGVKIGPSLRFSAQATVDLTKHKHELKTVDYILTYNNSCCTRWELTYHDDKLPGDKDNWFTLTFAINAFPDTAFKWGNHSVSNPFGLPGKLTPKRKPGYVPTMMEADGTQQAEDGEIRVPVFDL